MANTGKIMTAESLMRKAFINDPQIIDGNITMDDLVDSWFDGNNERGRCVYYGDYGEGDDCPVFIDSFESFWLDTTTTTIPYKLDGKYVQGQLICELDYGPALSPSIGYKYYVGFIFQQNINNEGTAVEFALNLNNASFDYKPYYGTDSSIRLLCQCPDVLNIYKISNNYNTQDNLNVPDYTLNDYALQNFQILNGTMYRDNIASDTMRTYVGIAAEITKNQFDTINPENDSNWNSHQTITFTDVCDYEIFVNYKNMSNPCDLVDYTKTYAMYSGYKGLVNSNYTTLKCNCCVIRAKDLVSPTEM